MPGLKKGVGLRVRRISEPSLQTDATKENEPPPSYKTVHSMNFKQPEKEEERFKPKEKEDPVDEYYRRYTPNMNTVTANDNTQFRRLPAYIRQFRARKDTMQSGISRRSGKSTRSTKSRTGLPQAPPIAPSNRFLRSFYFIASKHRLVGLRHLLLVAFFFSYAVGGMFMFYRIEAPYERKNVEETRVALNEAFDIIAKDLRVQATTSNKSMALQVKNAYIRLLKIDGKYTGSTFFKLESKNTTQYTWTHGTAFFFAFTLYSTVGYGSIAPSTELGRWCTIFYTAIFFPITLVIIRDIGQLMLVALTTLYARLLINIRAASGYVTTEFESIKLPIKICLLLSFGYCLSTAVFIYHYDSFIGPEPGLDLFHAFYFSFLSFAAVGLGDIMPVNYNHSPIVAVVLLCAFIFWHSPIVAVVLLCGFPLMRVVNRVLYIGIENGLFGSMIFIERAIDSKAPPTSGDTVTPVAPPTPLDVETTKEISDSISTLEPYEELSEEEDEEEAIARERLLSNFTIRSLATFMASGADVYKGDYGRVNLRKGDL